jgi:hypothetical protein
MGNAAIVIVAGVAYYFLHTNLVGIAAAIAAPRWFVPFMQEHQVLGLVLFSLVTTVPAVAISAALTGYVLARFAPDKYFLYGLLSVCIVELILILQSASVHGFWGALHYYSLPLNAIRVPMFIAFWSFLPLATMYFGRRKQRDIG